VKKKLCIVGHGRHGKDTIADWFDEWTDLVHPGSLSWFLATAMVGRREFPPGFDAKVLAIEVDPFSVVRRLWNRRHDDREFWKAYGTRLREREPGILIKTALGHGDMVVGCRDKAEIDYLRSENLVDLIIWVERAGFEKDPTIEFGPEVADIVILNDTDVAGLTNKVERLAKFAGIFTRRNYTG
jgi:hypothetical protein